MSRAKKQKPSMRRVAEGIYQRPSGKYVAPVYDPQTGKRRYDWPGVPRGGFDSLEDARGFKRRMESEKRDRGSSRETCGEFAARWPRDFPKPAETTNLHNAERISKFARDFAVVPLGHVSKARARQWALENPGRFKAVRAMFESATRDGLIASNPFGGLKLPEPDGRAGIVVLTGEEVDRLSETAAEVWGGFGEQVFGPMIQTAAYTGLRPGELYALRRSAVDWDRDELHVLKQLRSKTRKEALPKGRKGGKTRTITLLPRARGPLKRVPRAAEHVFTDRKGRVFSQRALHDCWVPVRKAFWGGLSPERQREIEPDFAFYTLRHFYGTHLMVDWGLSAYEIADQMGHSDGGVLAAKLYCHPVSRDVREKFRRRIAADQAAG